MAEKLEFARVPAGVVRDAQKILGKDAKIPDFSIDPRESQYHLDAGIGLYAKALQTTEAGLGSLKNLCSRVINQARDSKLELDSETFGLNADDPEDQKRIAAARKVFAGYFDEHLAHSAACARNVIEELKIVIDLIKRNDV